MITKIVGANKNNLSEQVTMVLDLWPDNTFEGLETDMLDLIDGNKDILLMSITDENTSGFIYISVRTDYVEGSDSSLVAYIEGIYIKPGFRKEGIARLLFKAGEDWAKDNGCTQIGSDIEWDNTVSYDFHRKIGFEEVNRIICFIKDIK